MCSIRTLSVVGGLSFLVLFLMIMESAIKDKTTFLIFIMNIEMNSLVGRMQDSLFSWLLLLVSLSI